MRTCVMRRGPEVSIFQRAALREIQVFFAAEWRKNARAQTVREL